MKVLQQFAEAVFLLLPMESVIAELEVLLLQTRITAEKGQNFWFDRRIALKVLH